MVLDDISEYDKKLDSYTCTCSQVDVYKIMNVFLYYHAVNFCVGLPLKRNTVGPMFVVFIHRSFAPIAKGWWVGANCVQGGVNTEFVVQIICKLSAVIGFPCLFVSSLH